MTDVLSCIFFSVRSISTLTGKALWKPLNQEFLEELLLSFIGMPVFAEITSF